MTDATPTPPPETPPGGVPAPPASSPPPPPPVPTGGGSTPIAAGVVKVRDPLVVVLLSIVTLGIYHLYWTYQVFRELKETQREGIGPVIALVIALVIGFVNLFVLPSEIGKMYERAGLEKPVRGPTGFWNLIPLVGWIVWIYKCQNALNHRWEAVSA